VSARRIVRAATSNKRTNGKSRSDVGGVRTLLACSATLLAAARPTIASGHESPNESIAASRANATTSSCPATDAQRRRTSHRNVPVGAAFGSGLIP
jgi:hypothetical protein